MMFTLLCFVCLTCCATQIDYDIDNLSPVSLHARHSLVMHELPLFQCMTYIRIWSHLCVAMLPTLTITKVNTGTFAFIILQRNHEWVRHTPSLSLPKAKFNLFTQNETETYFQRDTYFLPVYNWAETGR